MASDDMEVRMSLNCRIREFTAENSIEVTWEEACWFGFFILLSVTKGLGLYEGQKLFELLVLPAFLLAAVKLAITPYTKRQWIMQIILLLLVGLVFYHSHERGILFLAFTVLGMKDISVKKAVHVGVWVWSACAVFLSIVSFFRIEHTVYRVHAKLGLGHIFRWSLGFSHPNILHVTYLALCALLLYEMGERYRFRHFCLLMAGNLLVFFYSVSYTGCGIVAVLLAGGLYVRIRPRFCIVEKLLANLVLPVCLILSFVLPFYLYDNRLAGFVQKLNFMLNTRIWLAEQFLRSEYRSLFGADISRVVRSSMTMDNSYVWGYINYGLVFFGLLMAGYFALLFYDTHRQRTRELVILVCFLGAGWTEPLLFNTSFKNVTLLFLGSFLFRQKAGEREYCLFPGLQGTVRIPFAGWPDRVLAAAGRIWKRSWRKLLGLTAAGAVAGVILCGIFYRAPEGYVVQRFYTDGLEKTSVYLDSPEDPDYQGWKVMNYVDADTPMQTVQGKAVTLETARYYTGSLLIGAFLGGMAGMLYCAESEESPGQQGKSMKAGHSGRALPDREI